MATSTQPRWVRMALPFTALFFASGALTTVAIAVVGVLRGYTAAPTIEVSPGATGQHRMVFRTRLAESLESIGPGEVQNDLDLGAQVVGVVGATDARRWSALTTYPDTTRVMREEGAGWPWRALYWRERAERQGLVLERGIRIGKDARPVNLPHPTEANTVVTFFVPPLTIPIGVHLPGFLRDTFCFGGAWTLLAATAITPRAKRRPKRLVLRLAAYLVLGAAVALVLAISSAAFPARLQSAPSRHFRLDNAPSARMFVVYSCFGHTEMTSYPKEGVHGIDLDAVPIRSLPAWWRPIAPPMGGQGQIGVGWPFVCLRGGWDTGLVGPAESPRPGVVYWGVWTIRQAGPRIGPDDAYRGRWPINVVWWGLLLNAALFGTGLFLVRNAIAAVRRKRRARRGRCPKCAYDLRGLGAGTRCPECGARGDSPAPAGAGG